VGVLASVGALASGCACAAQSCRVLDAYSDVVQVARATARSSSADQIGAFKTSILAAHPELYAAAVLDVSPGARMDAKIIAALAAARAQRGADELMRVLRADLDAAVAAFARFADFRCDFPVYLMDALGQLDGAGRIVGGRRALVLGIDVLLQERTAISLPVFVTHELFHRYHYQAAGFSDDLGQRQPIWKVLWAEGLATYASEVLTQGATRRDALMLPPDLEQRAAPMLPLLAAQLLQHLDQTDANVFTTYFTYGNESVARRGLPWRSGYYVGYRVAEQLALRHPIEELPHLKGAALHGEIEAALRQLAMRTP
jgi:uncharacterized protein YjaZ